MGGGKGPTNLYPCHCLHSGVGPQRQANLQAFKDGEVRFLICTDVAARGIDIRGLPFVINVTLPDKPEEYIHRIGRVGRADRMGLAVSLVATEPEKVCCGGVKWATRMSYLSLSLSLSLSRCGTIAVRTPKCAKRLHW